MIREVWQAHRDELEALPHWHARHDRLCEVNVQDAWARGQDVAIHGWIYALHDGLIKDLDVTVSRTDEVERLG